MTEQYKDVSRTMATLQNEIHRVTGCEAEEAESAICLVLESLIEDLEEFGTDELNNDDGTVEDFVNDLFCGKLADKT